MRTLNIFVGAYVSPLRIGAYGAVIEENGRTMELSACYKPITERRIRLLGVVDALCSLREPCEVTVYTDSEYIVDTFKNNRAEDWRIRGWRLRDGTQAKNADLWKIMLDLIENHNVRMTLIPTHNGNEYGHEYNARCDKLAIEAVKRG